MVWHTGTSLIAIGNNIFGVNDGIFSWSDRASKKSGWNVTIEDNYLHDLPRSPRAAISTVIKTEGASHGVIRHNTFYITQDQNAAVSIWNSRADSDDFLIDDNLAAGSGFLMYAEDYDPSEQHPQGGYSVTNIFHNRLSTALYPCAGRYGVWYPRGAPSDGWHRSGNKILESGESIDISNPHVKGQLCR